MKGGLYIRLAASGISKNRKLYFPYLLTCICMVMMFYIVTFLAGSRNLKNLPGAETLQDTARSWHICHRTVFCDIPELYRLFPVPQTAERVRSV